LSDDPQISDLASTLAGRKLEPHLITTLRTHINYTPLGDTSVIDDWHRDSVGFALVIVVEVSAGAGPCFEVKVGKHQVLHGSQHRRDSAGALVYGLPLVPGEAILIHGSRLMHRARRPYDGGSRTTLVVSFVLADNPQADETVLAPESPGIPSALWRAECERYRKWRQGSDARS
jgi:hypothetical protein